MTAANGPERMLASPNDATLHPDVRPLAFLIGRWEGSGDGIWPPGARFAYGEEMAFEHIGDAFLMYAQKSWSADDGSPLHFERGFVRPGPPGRVEMTLAHSLGVVEVAEGTLTGGIVDLTATRLALTSTASAVTGLRRRFEVADRTLRYELWMALSGGTLTRHLLGQLKRVEPR